MIGPYIKNKVDMNRIIKVGIFLVSLMTVSSFLPDNQSLITFKTEAHAPNNGSYSKTSQSVTIYSESGHCVGSFSIYLHQGKKYIDFRNTWVCIQGKQRFGFQGNWYIIK